jgi:hypothetical protein
MTSYESESHSPSPEASASMNISFHMSVNQVEKTRVAAPTFGMKNKQKYFN